MKIDQELIEALGGLEEKRREARLRAERTKELEHQRIEALARERQARRDELCQYAEIVLRWREEFLRTPEAQRIWAALGENERLPLFFAKFWRGEPCPPNDRATCAVITLDDLWHYYHYEERHKGMVSFKSQRLATTDDLCGQIHPEMLRQLFEHLSGPNALSQVAAYLKCLAVRG